MAEVLTILGAVVLGVLGNAVWDLCKVFLDTSKKMPRLAQLLRNLAKSTLFLHVNQTLQSLGEWLTSAVPVDYEIFPRQLLFSPALKKNPPIATNLKDSQ